MTSTSTSTATAATSTIYAACNPDNFADTLKGVAISTIEALNNERPQYNAGVQFYGNVATAYDCCVLGFNDGTGNQYSVFQWFVNSQVCALNEVSGGAPLNNQHDTRWTVTRTNDYSNQRVVGNLNNGLIDRVGPNPASSASAIPSASASARPTPERRH